MYFTWQTPPQIKWWFTLAFTENGICDQNREGGVLKEVFFD